ncbi:MAG: branched-chain amino acid ABC transporter permease, partial [Lachnospiraceae bacterium]|nr:branched-chain amino acid ABC transporter permease [Lachnospiraceae bacterium]
KKDRKVALVVIISMFLSWLCTKLPAVRDISSGTRIIILTVIMALLAAALFPVPEEGKDEN